MVTTIEALAGTIARFFPLKISVRDVPLKPCDSQDFKMEVDSQQNQAHNIGFPIHGTNVIYPYHIQDRIKTDCFPQNLVTELKGSDFNLTYIQKHGFEVPVLFRDKEGLGLKVPGPKFSVRHVRMYIGSKYDLEVFDVGSGRTGLMLMRDFYKYYRDPNKDRLLDVLSLEFSHTKMNNLILAPSVVRELDWAECTWPKTMKQAHSSHKALKYPKVQKYCLLSVKGCYTDFHTEIGGSASWYHVVRGKKIFWLIPPTEHNLELYEQWLVSEKSPSTFLGDKVEKCGRCTLSPGETLLIPSGWLHAVYAQRDTLMFGGKFLHSFGIDAQLKVAKLDKIRRRPRSSRYPLFTEMLWFVLEGYVHRLLGHSYCSEKAKTEVESDICHTHLTSQELHGLKSIVLFLHILPANEKHVPQSIKDPIGLIKDVRTLVEQHRHDDHTLAITGKAVLGNILNTSDDSPSTLEESSVQPGGASTARRRRTHCRKCPSCLSKECGSCYCCRNMVKFGGTRQAKQSCARRLCLQPVLPVTTVCSVCGLDGWRRHVTHPATAGGASPSLLMECILCMDIVHRNCAEIQYRNHHGIVYNEMPSFWKCPKCCKEGGTFDHKKMPLRIQLTQQMLRNSIRILKKPYFTVRPSSAISKISIHDWMSPAGNNVKVPQLDSKCLLPVFKFLSQGDLYQCSQVCKTWSQCTIHPSLWQTMDVSHKQLTVSSLIGIVRRQPKLLILDWAQVSKRQLEWLLGRLPQLKKLSLHGCPWGDVSALKTCLCPPLTSLDLSFVSGLHDALLRDLLSAPMDTRPGLTESKCRLKGLQMLKLAGCDISDLSLRYIVQCLPTLKFLDVSLCSRITDAGVAQLGIHPASTIVTLEKLDLSSCRLLTDSCLEHLTQCKALARLDLRYTSVTSGAIEKFILDSAHGLKVVNEKLLIEMVNFNQAKRYFIITSVTKRYFIITSVTKKEGPSQNIFFMSLYFTNIILLRLQLDIQTHTHSEIVSFSEWLKNINQKQWIGFCEYPDSKLPFDVSTCTNQFLNRNGKYSKDIKASRDFRLCNDDAIKNTHKKK
ncbi:unnamed protein product [Timema podura]|uniref:[Histone H3]-dimethyl-L-lysine(36) demethylase n=1 Tax=Timema podura TaxID=61482 RepID=A0ABN7NFK2_TIMPD|nr:unnamed protein product [Timema podura]